MPGSRATRAMTRASSLSRSGFSVQRLVQRPAAEVVKPLFSRVVLPSAGGFISRGSPVRVRSPLVPVMHETEQSPRGPSRWTDFPVRCHDKLAGAGRQDPPEHRRGNSPRLLKRGGDGRDRHGSTPQIRLRGRSPPAGRRPPSIRRLKDGAIVMGLDELSPGHISKLGNMSTWIGVRQPLANRSRGSVRG